MTPTEKFQRRQSRTILRELIDRIAEQCALQGREDLVAGVYMLEGLAIAHLDALRVRRSEIIGILARDENLVSAAGAFAEWSETLIEAQVEKLDATIQ